MRSLKLQDFLLMLIAASVTKKTPTEIYAAYEAQKPQTERTTTSYSDKDVNEIYRAYPSRDPANGNRRTGKSLSNKDIIRRKLATYTKEEIMAAIKAELDENRTRGKWLKNFGTFLNNLPDLQEDQPEQRSFYQ